MQTHIYFTNKNFFFAVKISFPTVGLNPIDKIGNNDDGVLWQRGNLQNDKYLKCSQFNCFYLK